jgi:hypothetical protein
VSNTDDDILASVMRMVRIYTVYRGAVRRCKNAKISSSRDTGCESDDDDEALRKSRRKQIRHPTKKGQKVLFRQLLKTDARPKKETSDI